MAELLAPAGNVEALDAAIGEGADAVYMGLKSFNARLRSSNFAWNQFEAAVEAVHRQKKKIFVTVNTVSEERELERLYRFLAYLNKIGPDGLIVQDFGVVRMVQEFFPKLQLHASTQMNIASAQGVNLLSREGIKRVVLARELGLNEIKDIKAKTNAELEVFVHGALCVSESGLCLFSSFLGGKSANRGMCTQACRRLYEAESAGGLRQGYFYSPHDLQLIEKIPDLIMAGVDSFKIEGRMKSAEYVGSVTAAYRYLMDHWQEDKKGSIATAKRMLSTDFARAKTLYWYTSDKAENILNPDQAGGTGIYLGKIEKIKTDKKEYFAHSGEDSEENPSEKVTETHTYALVRGGTYDPEVGDSIRLHKKDDTGRVSHKIKTLKMGSYDDVKTNAGIPWIDVPQGFGVGDSVYLIQTKTMSKRYAHVLPNDLSRYRSQPGGQELPIMDLTPQPKEGIEHFPAGLWVQVSTITDMYTVQSEQPIRVILELNSETKAALIEKRENLPLSKKQIFISLDPYCPQAQEADLQDTLTYLIADGFKNFVVNNPAHINMLRGQKVSLIAGPYLYTFNRWAVSWLENQNIDALITPIENSRQNLEATFEQNQRKRVMITVFAYPQLFRMRFQLPESYDFTYFADKQGLVFKQLSTPDGSFVMPENPFSIIDKVVFMKNAGFTHFLLDLSKTRVTKGQFKQIMKAYYKGEPLPETSRFNWKDGFYSPEKMEEYKAANERAKESKNAYKSARSNKGNARKKSFTKKKGR